MHECLNELMKNQEMNGMSGTMIENMKKRLKMGGFNEMINVGTLKINLVNRFKIDKIFKKLNTWNHKCAAALFFYRVAERIEMWTQFVLYVDILKLLHTINPVNARKMIATTQMKKF